METLIWGSAALSVIGLCGIVYSIVVVTRAKSAGLDDAALRARISRILPVNLAALLMSVIGLMGVVLGIMLG